MLQYFHIVLVSSNSPCRYLCFHFAGFFWLCFFILSVRVFFMSLHPPTNRKIIFLSTIMSN